MAVLAKHEAIFVDAKPEVSEIYVSFSVVCITGYFAELLGSAVSRKKECGSDQTYLTGSH